MCGFAGFIGEVEDREQVLVNMMNTIIHREWTVRESMWMMTRPLDSEG